MVLREQDVVQHADGAAAADPGATRSTDSPLGPARLERPAPGRGPRSPTSRSRNVMLYWLTGTAASAGAALPRERPRASHPTGADDGAARAGRRSAATSAASAGSRSATTATSFAGRRSTTAATSRPTRRLTCGPATFGRSSAASSGSSARSRPAPPAAGRGLLAWRRAARRDGPALRLESIPRGIAAPQPPGRFMPPSVDRRLVILAEGNFGFHHGKTAMGVIRFGTDQVVAVIDSTQAGRNVREWLGDSGRFDIPIVASLNDALGFLPRANGLLIGIAPDRRAAPRRLAARDPRRDPVRPRHPLRAAHVPRRRPGVRRGRPELGRPDHRLPPPARAHARRRSAAATRRASGCSSRSAPTARSARCRSPSSSGARRTAAGRSARRSWPRARPG